MRTTHFGDDSTRSSSTGCCLRVTHEDGAIFRLMRRGDITPSPGSDAPVRPDEPAPDPTEAAVRRVPRGLPGTAKGSLSYRAVDVLLVDNRPVVREGLRAVIESQPDLNVVAQAPTVGDARSLEIAADVIVTDVDLPDAKLVDAISGLRELCPQCSILVFRRNGDPSEVQAVFTAGANGYLLETSPAADLLAAIRAVANGETYLQPSLGIELARSRSWDAMLRLTPQEEQVLRRLVLGHTNADIARLCNISLRTAETHRAHIQRKLDRHTRADLVEYAREHGLVQLDPQ
jgi:two-component system, NarL family, response regulator NreC